MFFHKLNKKQEESIYKSQTASRSAQRIQITPIPSVQNKNIHVEMPAQCKNKQDFKELLCFV